VLQHCCDDYQGNVGRDHCNYLRGVSPPFFNCRTLWRTVGQSNLTTRESSAMCAARDLRILCLSTAKVSKLCCPSISTRRELALCGERISKRLLHLKVCNRLAATVAPVAASPRQSSTASLIEFQNNPSSQAERARKILTRGQMLAFQSASTLCTRSVRTLPPPTASKMRPTCLACHCPTSATYITGAKET
jgi:hypothetical protein